MQRVASLSRFSTAVARDFLPRSSFVKGAFVSPWPGSPTAKNFNFFKIARVLLRRYFFEEKAKSAMPEGLMDLQKLYVKNSPVDEVKLNSQQTSHVTWMGHSTCLVQMDGLYILTDPVWSERASPLSFVGPKRIISPPITVESVPIDVVLLSHSHYDHMDVPTIKRIGNRALWIVPLGLKALLESTAGVTNCIEMDWNEKRSLPVSSTRLNKTVNVEVTCLAARHWSARIFWDRNQTLWASFALKTPNGNKLYFAGDTGYCDRLFKSIGNKHGPFDLSLLPIGAYKPRSFHGPSHCEPAQAVKMHQELRSKRSLGIHWGCFNLAEDVSCEPAFELSRARKVAGVSNDDFFTMGVGDNVSLSEPAHSDIARMFPDAVKEYEAIVEREAKNPQSTMSR